MKNGLDKYMKTEKQYSKVYLTFLKEVNAELIIETKYPIPNNNIVVMITDIRKNWQNPLDITQDIGNPKIKEMDRDTFDKTFKIISYA